MAGMMEITSTVNPVPVGLTDGQVFTCSIPNGYPVIEVHNESPLRLLLSLMNHSGSVAVPPTCIMHNLDLIEYLGDQGVAGGLILTITAQSMSGGTPPTDPISNEVRLFAQSWASGPLSITSLVRQANVGGSIGTTTTQLEGQGQTLPLTEQDSAGSPALMPGSGVSTKLTLAALNNLGNRVDMLLLDAVANTVSTPNGAQLLLTAAETITRTLAGSIKAYLNLTATDNNDYVLGIDADGTLVIRDVTNTTNILKVGPNKGFAQIGDQVTAGSYGAPVVIKESRAQSVVNNSATVICSVTAPAGATHWCRASLEFIVGAGNTNNGAVTVLLSYSDPVSGAITPNLNNYNGATAINATAVTKGTRVFTIPLTFEVSAGSNITLQYQNNVAGTISDRVNGSIEVLS